MQEFKSDKEIIAYLNESIESICHLDECRLYKEEQLQISEEVLHIRNCIEWIIRINKLVNHFKYAISSSFEYAQKVMHPLEDSKENDMYSYYLEDAVYRDIVLWDMFRQLLNEYYKCGYKETDQVSIFTFLKAQKTKIGEIRTNNVLAYLNSPEHKHVRTELRNSFTHSLETTLTYVFHKVDQDGFIKPQIEHFFPKHPYENICYVVDDIKQWNNIIKEIISEIHNELIEKIMIVNVTIITHCGLRENTKANISNLKEQYERIIFKCDKECKHLNKYNEINVCKPKIIEFCRVYEKLEEYKGVLKPILSFDEMKELYT